MNAPVPIVQVNVTAPYVEGDDAFKSIMDAAMQMPEFANMVPVPKTRLTHIEFMDRFWPGEESAIYASNDPVIQKAIRRFNLSTDVDLTRADLQMYVNYLVTVGILTADRATAILTP
jgi:hypothetical protein